MLRDLLLGCLILTVPAFMPIALAQTTQPTPNASSLDAETFTDDAADRYFAKEPADARVLMDRFYKVYAQVRRRVNGNEAVTEMMDVGSYEARIWQDPTTKRVIIHEKTRAYGAGDHPRIGMDVVLVLEENMKPVRAYGRTWYGKQMVTEGELLFGQKSGLARLKAHYDMANFNTVSPSAERVSRVELPERNRFFLASFVFMAPAVMGDKKEMEGLSLVRVPAALTPDRFVDAQVNMNVSSTVDEKTGEQLVEVTPEAATHTIMDLKYDKDGFLLAARIDGVAIKLDQDRLKAEVPATQSSSRKYKCPMHPEIALNEAGSCPTCGMDLIEAKYIGD